MAYEEEQERKCSHVVEALQDPAILNKYRTVIAWNVRRSQTTRNPAKRRKIAFPTCGICFASLARPFACLHCDFAGCWSGGHAVGHLKESGGDHAYCVDVKTGSIFCSQCDDVIYNPAVDRTYTNTLVEAEESETRYQVSKLRRAKFEAWSPSSEDLAALERSEPISCYRVRGLVNLGQTCFLNVVLQAFAHNPLLRNYFLSDRHSSGLCKVEDCTCCELDKLFSSLYDTPDSSPGPYAPVGFLTTTWRRSAELSGYAQQDAHELFIALLNHVHSTCRGSTNVACNCIIHSTFQGRLQSEVECERCNKVNTTVDPMLDISLEVPASKVGAAGVAGTLEGCLRRFTKPEKLPEKEYSCADCGKASQQANKRLSISELPPVLSFQFKRFEQKSTMRKLDAAIRFPSVLNMKPFTKYAMDDSDGYSHCGPDAIYEYDLFAVINHEGQMNNGHYTNYARCGDEWYRFDDDKVTPSTLAACLDSSALTYMCFYVKRHLEYKPHVVPTYRRQVVVDPEEKELKGEKERERERQKEMERKAKDIEEQEIDDVLLATI